MDKENKRYVVTMDMYVYADNDYMAKKRANDLRLSLSNRRHSQDVEVTSIHEQPFGTLSNRRVDDFKFTPKDTSNDPLPF
jgi:hypothetical protein